MTPQGIIKWCLIFSNSGILLNSKDSTQHGKATALKTLNRRQKQHISKIRRCTLYVPAGHSGGLSEPPHPQPHCHGDKKKHKWQRVHSMVPVIFLASSLLPWWWLNSNNRDIKKEKHTEPASWTHSCSLAPCCCFCGDAASIPLSRRPTLSGPEAGVSSLLIFILYRSRVGFGEGNGTPLQYSCLENPMDRGAWWATVHGVTKSRTELKRLIMHVSILFQILFPSRLSQSVG